MAYRIFLSHNWQDFALVQALIADAEAMGIQAYAFEHDRKPGKPVSAKLRRAIRDSHAVVAVLTRSGASSAYVHQEIGCAFSEGKLVIPIVEAGVRQEDLAMLQGIEYIRLDRNDLPGARRALATYLDHLKRKKEAADFSVVVGAIALLVFLSLKK